MKKQFVMGNWKMNGQQQQVVTLLNELLAALLSPFDANVVVFPPAIYLPLTATILSNSQLTWGGQNVYPKDFGAYTGELSAPMLKDYGCRYVLVGHSERRHLLGEDEKFVAEKFHHAKEHGIIPVLCVGETLTERQQGLTEEVLTKQLFALLQDDKRVFQQSVIAYEPVWAIGTGQTASPEQAQKVHKFIRDFVAEFNQQDASQLPILYGGSVNEKNAHALFSMPDIDGGLVGGASLNAQQFVDIIKCTNCY